MVLGLTVLKKMKKIFFTLVAFSVLTILVQLVDFNYISNLIYFDISKYINNQIASLIKENVRLLDMTNTCPYVSSGCLYFHSKYFYVEHFKNIELVSQLKNGDIVFVKTNLLDEFFKKVYVKITKKIFLISFHDDDSTNKDHEIYLKNNSKLIAWYSTNPGFFHINHIPIPLGLQSNYLEGLKFSHRTLHTAFKLMFNLKIKNEERVKFVKSVNVKKLIPWNKRKYTLYVNFHVHKKKKNEPDPGHRRRLRNAFKNFSNTFDAVREDYFSYMKSLENSKFVVCPQGLSLFFCF